MSVNTNPRRVSSKDSPHDGSPNNNNNNRANENIEKTTKQQHENSATPPELQRNEATARARSTIQRVADKTGESHDNKQNDTSSCPSKEKIKFRGTPGADPRFQQQNQTLRCFVMYTDFYRCEKILGDGHEACTWFRDVYTSICPNAWISRWDELRADGRLPWTNWKTQGDFPGDRYGV